MCTHTLDLFVKEKKLIKFNIKIRNLETSAYIQKDNNGVLGALSITFATLQIN